ncbi:hypothetical protein TNIN_121971 [Trichonephila inaurata madagascariensis]|uniref:Uncharacterized protein n=1 Tax=Trichonephila inaurata madagascariensis TaxID=2747483 RepID=A0A8X6WPM5_9ARAC|nr:hypothetical protein TNIN_121971 [Trichonephila inaurata madagascariensis]
MPSAERRYNANSILRKQEERRDPKQSIRFFNPRPPHASGHNAKRINSLQVGEKVSLAEGCVLETRDPLPQN